MSYVFAAACSGTGTHAAATATFADPTGTPAVGDLISVAIGFFAAASATTVIDSYGNTYLPVETLSSGSGVTVSIYQTVVGVTGTGFSVTVSVTGTPLLSVGALRFTPSGGTPGGDGANANSGNFTTSFTAGSIAMGGSADVMVAVACQFANSQTFTAGSGFTQAVNIPGVSGNVASLYVEYQTGASGTVNAGITSTSNAAYTMAAAAWTVVTYLPWIYGDQIEERGG